MSKGTYGQFRSVTHGAKSNSAANNRAHIPHKIPDQDPPGVKAKKAAAKATHMQVKGDKGMKLPYPI